SCSHVCTWHDPERSPRCTKSVSYPGYERQPREADGVESMAALDPIRTSRHRGNRTTPYSITSARVRRLGSMVRPSDLAVLALRINSNVVGCSVGSSPIFAPRRYLSTVLAIWR